MSSLTRDARFSDHNVRGLATLMIFSLMLATGCGREFYRNWADQDATEAVFEKSRDPRWRMELFSIEPPSLSRFADPYDPDRPPAPPDDPAAQALSPVPQWPHHRLLVPAEGTGYIDMLETWRREQPPQEDEDEKTEKKPSKPAQAAPPPPSTPSPFSQPVPAQPSQPSRPVTLPEEPGRAAPPPELTPPPLPEPLSGRFLPTTIPGQGTTEISLIPKEASSVGTPSRRGVKSPSRVAELMQPSQITDTSVQLTAFQANQPAQTATGATQPGSAPATGGEAPITLPPGLNPPRLDLDPQPGVGEVDLVRPADPRAGLDPDQYQEGGRRTAGLAGLLAPAAIRFDQNEAAALPKDVQPYVITPAQALKLALVNSRGYQSFLEDVYLRALDVTLQRWAFEPQFVAGMSPSTGTSAGSPSPSYPNSYLYRTREVRGGQSSTYSIGTLAGFGKSFAFGSRLVGGFANQVVFNFTGSRLQPSVESVLPLSLVVPLLRGGGRAVTMEPLTLSERNLLYQVRNFARFRQTFFPSILTSNQAANAGTGEGGAAGGDGSTGYLQVLQQLQEVENSRKTVAAFEQLLKGYIEMSQGGGSGVSQLNVDEVSSNLQGARQSLITILTAYRNSLDQYKIQLGLPPDVPIVLDRGLTGQFRQVFDDIDDWFLSEDRDPVDLPGFASDLPELDDVVIDGRSVLKLATKHERSEEVLLAAERVALENRYELMNARARLYDQWRQLAVTANRLKGIFDIRTNYQIFTPANTNNAFAFSDQANQFSVSFNTELPLVRLNERNVYRTALIEYRRQQRDLMQLEDQIKLQVRTDVRTLALASENYEIQKEQLIINLRRKDNSQRNIFAPPGPGSSGGSEQATATTQQLVQSQNQLLSAQNGLVRTWVTYVSSRISLYRDLGIIPYDEWEAFYELFPAESSNRNDGAAGSDGGAAAPPAARPAQERS